MDIALPNPGLYVVAVSGGVDSVSLLHRLQSEPGLKLVVAHFDHGIREDSAADRELVRQLAANYQLPFVYAEGQLGPGASEAEARIARYRFLRHVAQASQARAIITAHHQDDRLETAILNLLRGTGRKGLTALSSRHDVVRPLLTVSKADLLRYAHDQALQWHEDSTNFDLNHLRSYVRHRLLPRFNPADRERLLALIENLQTTNAALDDLLTTQLHLQTTAGRLDRHYFNQLPHNVAREVLAAWFRAHGLRSFDRRALERLVVAAKTAPPGQIHHVRQGVNLTISADYLALT